MSAVWIVAIVLLWVVVLVIGFLMAGVLRQLGLLELRLGPDPGALITRDGLERGTIVPDFEAVDATTGERQSLFGFPPARRLIVFLSPSCGVCQQVAESLGRIAEARREFRYLVVCSGRPGACRTLTEAASARPNVNVLVDDGGTVEKLFQVTATPFGYLVDGQGRVLIRGIVNHERHLDALLDEEGTLEPVPFDVVHSDPSSGPSPDQRERSVPA